MYICVASPSVLLLWCSGQSMASKNKTPAHFPPSYQSCFEVCQFVLSLTESRVTLRCWPVCALTTTASNLLTLISSVWVGRYERCLGRLFRARACSRVSSTGRWIRTRRLNQISVTHLHPGEQPALTGIFASLIPLTASTSPPHASWDHRGQRQDRKSHTRAHSHIHTIERIQSIWFQC